MANGRLMMCEPLIHEQFILAMDTLRDHQTSLNDYDRGLFQDMHDGYEFAGVDFGVTVRQFNHLRQVAMELEQLEYRSNS